MSHIFALFSAVLAFCTTSTTKYHVCRVVLPPMSHLLYVQKRVSNVHSRQKLCISQCTAMHWLPVCHAPCNALPTLSG